MQVSTTHNLAVGVGKYVKKVEIICLVVAEEIWHCFVGYPSWLVQINDAVSESARQKRRGGEGG